MECDKMMKLLKVGTVLPFAFSIAGQTLNKGNECNMSQELNAESGGPQKSLRESGGVSSRLFRSPPRQSFRSLSLERPPRARFAMRVSPKRPETSILTPATPEELVNPITNFGLKLHSWLVKNHPEMKNTVACPLSAWLEIIMASLGAKGDTTKEISTALGLGCIDDDTQILAKKLRSMLLENASTGEALLKIEAHIFGQEGYLLDEKFINDVKSYHDADTTWVNFQGSMASAVQEINKWVKTATNGMIEKMVDARSLNQSTKVMLMNAIYFKGEWSKKFTETKPLPFHLKDNKTVNVQMMFEDMAQEDVKYGSDTELGCEFLELLYKGDKLSMVVILPKKGTNLDKVEKSLSARILQKIKLDSMPVTVGLPKFKVTSLLNLKPFLNGLGVKRLFNTDMTEAELKGISGQSKLSVNGMIQKAVIEVNEKGTEAAAVTTADCVDGDTGTQVFIANRPFLYVVRDNVSKCPLFIGRVIDPSSV